eukprot:scaffold2858_cov659-Pavlova_lutheri.AAC.198
MGGIDIVINNAGTNAYVYENLADADVEKVREVVLTNALGTVLCCREALRNFREQPEGGHIFNLEGAGSDGKPTKKFAAYGYTKAGMGQLSRTLQVEVNEAGGPSVGVHTISPGMIFTEMIASGRYSFGERGRFFVNLLAEDANVVADSLVQQIRAVVAKPEAKSKTQSIQYLKPPDVFKRLLARLVWGKNKDRWYPERELAQEIPVRERLPVHIYQREGSSDRSTTHRSRLYTTPAPVISTSAKLSTPTGPRPTPGGGLAPSGSLSALNPRFCLLHPTCGSSHNAGHARARTHRFASVRNARMPSRDAIVFRRVAWSLPRLSLPPSPRPTRTLPLCPTASSTHRGRDPAPPRSAPGAEERGGVDGGELVT